MSRRLGSVSCRDPTLSQQGLTLGDDLGSDLLESQEAVVIDILQLHGAFEGNSHAYLFVGSVRQHLEDQYFLEFLGDLDQEGPVTATGGLDTSREVGIRVCVLEDDQISETDLLAFLAE